MDDEYPRDEALYDLIRDLERAASNLLAELDRPAEDRLPVVMDKAVEHLRKCAYEARKELLCA